MNTPFIILFASIIISLFLIFLSRKTQYQWILFSSSSIERFSLLFLGITFTPILIFGTLVSFITIFREIKSTKKLFIPRGLLLGIVLIGISCFLTSVFSPYRYISLKASLYYFIYLILLLGQYTLIRKIQRLQIISTAMLFALGGFVIYGFLQEIRFLFNMYPDIFSFVTPYSNALSPLDFIFHIDRHTFLRPNSGFNDVNTAAGFLLLYIPSFIVFTCINFKEELRSRYYSYIYLVVLISSILLLILMNSRSSILSLGVLSLIAIVYYISKFRKNKQLLILGIILSCIIFLGIFEHSFFSRMILQIYHAEYSAQAHIFYSKAALNEFTTYPFFGGGSGSFAKYYHEQMLLGKVPYADSVDNPPLFLKLLAENGILGLFSFAALLSYPLVKTFKLLKMTNNKKYKLVVFAALFGYVAILSANLLHAYFFLFFTSIYIGYYVGILDNTAINQDKKNEEKIR